MEDVLLNACLIIAVLLAGLFNYGCWLINWDIYWFRVWDEAGRPRVSTVDELKVFLMSKKIRG